MAEKLAAAYGHAKPKAIINWAGQVWSFKEAIKPNDLVVLPLKTRSALAIGAIAGAYEYVPDNPDFARHTRKVSWIRDDIPRASVDQDLLYSLGAFLTVCRISRNNAEERIKALLAGAPQPAAPDATTEAGAESAGLVNLEEQAQDQIRFFINSKFKGHGLASLVTAVLKAQGYQIYQSPPGADGGVDVIAGKGPMGFDPPRLLVQVKSQQDPVDVRVLRELQGVMRGYGAEQALLVAWGGFKNAVIDEARRRFFEIRLWDAGDLVTAITENYDRLPAEIKAELPMRRIWAVVPEE